MRTHRTGHDGSFLAVPGELMRAPEVPAPTWLPTYLRFISYVFCACAVYAGWLHSPKGILASALGVLACLGWARVER